MKLLTLTSSMKQAYNLYSSNWIKWNPHKLRNSIEIWRSEEIGRAGRIRKDSTGVSRTVEKFWQESRIGKNWDESRLYKSRNDFSNLKIAKKGGKWLETVTETSHKLKKSRKGMTSDFLEKCLILSWVWLHGPKNVQTESDRLLTNSKAHGSIRKRQTDLTAKKKKKKKDSKRALIKVNT